MTSKRVLLLFVLSIGAVLAGCAGTDLDTNSTGHAQTRADEPGATRATRESATLQQRSPLAPETAVIPPAPAVERPLFVAHLLDAREGEDGRGQTVRAARVIAFDLDARRFPPRALDPVLYVGELRFTHYTHPSPGLLRFVAADTGSLVAGVPVHLQYGAELAGRTLLTDAWVMP